MDMKNLYVIPTDKPSRLRYNLSNVLVFTKELYRDYGKEANQNIYITNSEEIKEGDWCHTIGTSLFNEQIGRVTKQVIVDNRKCGIIFKKIILTTDQDLIKDGVQPIDDEFLEWFVKNPSCERVETKLVHDSEDHPELIGNPRELWSYYEIIIPQEEYNPCKDIVINDKVTIDVTFHNKHIRFENLTSEQAGYLIQVSEQIEDIDKAASKSAEITKQIAIEFAEWLDYTNEQVKENSNYESWFEEYLKTK
jgi:hypothetical protein